jgi:hypothetical protein
MGRMDGPFDVSGPSTTLMLTGMVSRIGIGVNALKTANASAARQRAIATENRFIRSIQARQLLSAGVAAMSSSGFAVGKGSAFDVASWSAYMEGLGIGRSGYREEALAAQTEAAGLGKALEAGLGFYGDARRYGEIRDRYEMLESERMSGIAERQQAVDDRRDTSVYRSSGSGSLSGTSTMDDT